MNTNRGKSNLIPIASAHASGIVNESVYDALKRQILSNQLRPGNKLGHQELAESLGVSRTPVRESLERLYQEGFVVRVPNRGYYVAEISASEAQQLYETREALEVYVLRGLLERGISEENLAMLEGINRKFHALIGGELTRQRLLVDPRFPPGTRGNFGQSVPVSHAGVDLRTADPQATRRRLSGYRALRRTTSTSPCSSNCAAAMRAWLNGRCRDTSSGRENGC